MRNVAVFDLNFGMFAFDPENENEDEQYWLWRFMIDRNKQKKKDLTSSVESGQCKVCFSSWRDFQYSVVQ